MRTTGLAPLIAPALAASAAPYSDLPAWYLLSLAGVSVALTTARVAVTQIIRLRVSARIATSSDAVRVLEIEDLSYERRHPMRR